MVHATLLRALDRLRNLILRSDDSGGVLGSACDRAAALFARASREGKPDPRKLGRWLVRFRAESPGWPETPLAEFAPALGDVGIETFRRGVAKLAEKSTDHPWESSFELDQMQLELSDRDGDVDLAKRSSPVASTPSTGR